MPDPTPYYNPSNSSIPQALNTATGGLYKFALAAIVLYLIMRYVPHGVEIGLIILLGGILSSSAAASNFSGFLRYIQG